MEATRSAASEITLPAEQPTPTELLDDSRDDIRLGDVRFQQTIQAPSEPSQHDARSIRDPDSLWNHPCGKNQEEEEKERLITRLWLSQLQMFGVSGVGLANIKYYQNGGKRARRSLDQWDRQSTRH